MVAKGMHDKKEDSILVKAINLYKVFLFVSLFTSLYLSLDGDLCDMEYANEFEKVSGSLVRYVHLGKAAKYYVVVNDNERVEYNYNITFLDLDRGITWPPGASINVEYLDKCLFEALGKVFLCRYVFELSKDNEILVGKNDSFNKYFEDEFAVCGIVEWSYYLSMFLGLAGVFLFFRK